MKTRVAILISGGGSNMVSLARAMSGDFPARPVLVISNRPDAGGLEKAKALGIETAVVDHRRFADRSGFEDALHDQLVNAQVDFVCLAGFMRILGPHFVAKWAGKMLNIHPSLLPKYPGLNTHARALEAGDKTAGCSVHWVTPDLDEGPMLGQATVNIVAGDTPESLAARVLEKEHLLYPKALHAALVGSNELVQL